jgi:hypothetical protein
LMGGVPARLVYDNLTLAVRRIIGGERELSERFKALASHYLYEPCFTRVGQGHDKGGVENRGKNIRLQHMTPIPRGENLGSISEALLKELDDSRRTKLNVDKTTAAESFAEEKKYLRPLPPTSFDARRVVMCAVSNKAMVRVGGADYAVPSTWARLDATAYIGLEDISICCLGQEIRFPKQQPGARYIKYRNYLPELQRKPQAVRQVAPQLMEELGDPFPLLWKMLSEVYGGREAGRVLSRILGAVIEHGEEAVKEALSKALAVGKCDLLALAEKLRAGIQAPYVAVPESLLGYEVEQGRAADYDWMLQGGLQ